MQKVTVVMTDSLHTLNDIKSPAYYTYHTCMYIKIHVHT